MIVYTDGSRIPGQDNGGYAGIGIWFGFNNMRNTSIPIRSPNATNQSAELLAIKYALLFCKDTKELIIRSDSKYSINCVTLWCKTWQKNGWKTSKGENVVNIDLIKEIIKLISDRESRQYETSFEHVYGHKGNEGNEGADKLAVAASLKLEKESMDNTIYFYDHNNGPYKSFSQFYMCSISVDHNGIVYDYDCMEQYQHHQKALLFNDNETADKIMDASQPHVQFKLGRQVRGFSSDIWDREKYNLSIRGHTLKYQQHPDLLSILLSTKGKRIAESAPSDCVWGIGISASQSKARVKWKGQNLLGKVLMDIRDNIF